jgi:LmbE family N-acetylglucosaminyl deacetylase
MMPLNLSTGSDGRLKVLCIGAHSDDIEIGCGGTLLTLAERISGCEFYWVVFTASGVREAEATRGAQLFAGPRVKGLYFKAFKDGFLPFNGADVKGVFENELKQTNPDLIFTHSGKDAHQDHRLLSELTWNTFRNHLILEYEIPKYDGDLGRPNVFVPLKTETSNAKIAHLMTAFASQQKKSWFEPETFLSLMRLRGMECVSDSGYAEAFYSRKLVL